MNGGHVSVQILNDLVTYLSNHVPTGVSVLLGCRTLHTLQCNARNPTTLSIRRYDVYRLQILYYRQVQLFHYQQNNTQLIMRQ